MHTLAHKGAMCMFEPKDPNKSGERPDVDDLIFDEEAPCSGR